MTGARTLYSAAWVLPMAAAPLPNGAVLVEGDAIAWVGAAAAFPESADVRRVDLGAAALLPGLVNAHSHLELTTLRGYLEGFAFRDWLVTLTRVRRDVLTAEDLLDASRLGIVEALAHGITTLADTTDSAAPLVAMRELGVRGIGYVEVFGPDPVQRDGSMARLRERVADLRTQDTALVRTGISPHAPYTVSVPLFRAAAEYARAEALPMAVHIAESAAEVAFVVEGAGPFADGLRARGIAVAPQARSPIALLDACGVLEARPLLIHAIRTDDDDLARVADAGATIVHCPVSNAKLGHAIAPLDRMLAHGIATGLGTDSVASNDRMHLLEEARQACLFHALRSGEPDSLHPSRALELATVGGARALGLDTLIGTLEVGKQADLAAFPLVQPWAPAVFDPTVTLVHVLGGSARASLVTVAGKELVRGGEVLGVDPGLYARVESVSGRLRRDH
ncbi:MAG: amidohydrolase family protein [Gemmatimonadaceae bacterium]|nr:amidohydrolase family protein [Gemmatimonadaceae bacterium]